MVVMEAFGCSVPVITVKCPQNAAYEHVSEKTGLVAELDAVELSNAIRTLITDGTLRGKMSVAALEVAHGFDWDMIAAQLSCLYGEFIPTNTS